MWHLRPIEWGRAASLCESSPTAGTTDVRFPRRGVRGLALARHRGGRFRASAAAAWRHRGGRRGRRRRLHRALDGLLPTRPGPQPARRDRRARDSRVRGVGPERRLVLVALPARLERHSADARASGRRGGPARDAQTVAEVGRIADAEGIDAGYARGGTISLARNEAQLLRARGLVDEERRLTGTAEGLQLLSKEEAEELARGDARARRRLRPALRRRPPAPARARARRAGRGAGRLDLRADRRQGAPAGRRGHRARHRSRRRGRARHRGLHAEPPRRAAAR